MNVASSSQPVFRPLEECEALPAAEFRRRWFDTRTLDNARREAETILAEDPSMSSETWRPLRDHAARFWRELAPDLMLA